MIPHHLEFEKIKEQLQHFCYTEKGKMFVEHLMPFQDPKEVQEQLNQTQDGIDSLRIQGSMPFTELASLDEQLDRLAIGATLDGLELYQILQVLSVIKDMKHYFIQLSEKKEDFLAIHELIETLDYFPDIYDQLEFSVDASGFIKDSASAELKRIRRQIRQTEQYIKRTLEQMIHGKNAAYLREQLITMRNDRYVIPVKQEYRNKFGGIVHDQSASGQTLFIEPQQLLPLNDQLKEHIAAEHAEIERILQQLSTLLGPVQHLLRSQEQVLGTIDFIQAKAQYAKSIDATIPCIDLDHKIQLYDARHPLIPKEQAVANDLILGDQFDTLLITGPNTGGKTIALKTIGLLQVMGQSGLALPVASQSFIGVFQKIFADIGDEQSIEHNLSTFSSHMKNIIHILSHSDEETLVLLDELGSGTDPQEGAVLAIAILDELRSKSSKVVATTHYPELKIYAYTTPDVMNASMEFDVETLTPTYQLRLGAPGSSNAFAISKRLGLPHSVLKKAEQLLSQEDQALQHMILSLETERKDYEEKVKQLNQELEEATQLHQDLSDKYQLLIEERNHMLQKAEAQAQSYLNTVEQEAQEIIDALRAYQKLGQAHIKDHQLIEQQQSLKQLKSQELARLEDNKVLKKEKEKQEFAPGDQVKVLTYGQVGELLRLLDEDHWEVQLGILKMKVSEEDLELVKKGKDLVQQSSSSSKGVKKTTSNQHISATLDLRGKRYEEALHELELYIDRALLQGYPRITVIHGKGTGALKSGVTQFLSKHRHVAHYEFAPLNQGGDGATIVTFK